MQRSQKGQLDGQFARQAAEEISDMLEERVIIKRFEGVSGGDAKAGVAATDDFRLIRTKAIIQAMTARKIGQSNGILRLGDLKAMFRIPIYAGTTYSGDQQTSGRKPDRVSYRGREYHVQGQVEDAVHARGKIYYQATLRQVG